jgi:hypothetical protein
MAQAVYRWHLTMETLRTVKVSEICGEQSGTGTDFSSLSFPYQYNSITARYSLYRLS